MEAQMQPRLQPSSKAWVHAIGAGALTLLLSAPFSLAQQPASDDKGKKYKEKK
jgi:cytochrome c